MFKTILVNRVAAQTTGGYKNRILANLIFSKNELFSFYPSFFQKRNKMILFVLRELKMLRYISDNKRGIHLSIYFSSKALSIFLSGINQTRETMRNSPAEIAVLKKASANAIR